jgi:phage terminase Nu1 subunit (DNA packaging protein)
MESYRREVRPEDSDSEMSECVTALARWNLADAKCVLTILNNEMSECAVCSSTREMESFRRKMRPEDSDSEMSECVAALARWNLTDAECVLKILIAR